MYNDIQLDLDAVNAWCINNQITFNQSKTEYNIMNFSYRPNQLNQNTFLLLGEQTISETNSYKYLGTVLDSKLNCQAQYKNLIKKLSIKKITFSKITLVE